MSSLHAPGQPAIITSLNQLSDIAKGELRSWLEPWFEARGTAGGVGPRGPAGPTGPTGPPGTPGAGGDANYVHTQSTPASTWSVVHSLSKFPAVDVVDSGGNTLLADVLHVDANHVTVTFGSATSGRVFVN